MPLKILKNLFLLLYLLSIIYRNQTRNVGNGCNPTREDEVKKKKKKMVRVKNLALTKW